jgi:hypothetical protein
MRLLCVLIFCIVFVNSCTNYKRVLKENQIVYINDFPTNCEKLILFKNNEYIYSHVVSSFFYYSIGKWVKNDSIIKLTFKLRKIIDVKEHFNPNLGDTFEIQLFNIRNKKPINFYETCVNYESQNNDYRFEELFKSDMDGNLKFSLTQLRNSKKIRNLYFQLFFSPTHYYYTLKKSNTNYIKVYLEVPDSRYYCYFTNKSFKIDSNWNYIRYLDSQRKLLRNDTTNCECQNILGLPSIEIIQNMSKSKNKRLNQ